MQIRISQKYRGRYTMAASYPPTDIGRKAASSYIDQEFLGKGSEKMQAAVMKCKQGQSIERQNWRVAIT